MAVVHQTHEIPLTATEDAHDYDGDDVQVTPSGPGFSLRSLPPMGAVLGTEIVIVNCSAADAFTLPHDHASGTVGGRFFFSDGVDHNLQPYEQVWGVLRDVAGRVGWWMQF